MALKSVFVLCAFVGNLACLHQDSLPRAVMLVQCMQGSENGILFFTPPSYHDEIVNASNMRICVAIEYACSKVHS